MTVIKTMADVKEELNYRYAAGYNRAINDVIALIEKHVSRHLDEIDLLKMAEKIKNLKI